METKPTTLRTAVEQYIAHQTEIGQKPSTLGTIERSLGLLIYEMGNDKDVAKILPVHVANFFGSEAATIQPSKDGFKPRAPASILQIRRIVRAALVWWHEQGLIKNVPLPADERKFLEGKKGKKADATEPTTEPPASDPDHQTTEEFEAMGEKMAAELNPETNE